MTGECVWGDMTSEGECGGDMSGEECGDMTGEGECGGDVWLGEYGRNMTSVGRT